MNILSKFFKKKKNSDIFQPNDDKKDYLESIEERTIRDCRILYGRELGAQTWDCGKGWNEILSRLSYELEAMNIIYGKYGIHIIADQIKEKFGTLRFYHSLIQEIPIIYNFIPNILMKMYLYVSEHVNFKYKTVVDVETHHNNEICTISKDEYEKHIKDRINNVKYVKQDDGDGNIRYYRFSSIDVFQTSHKEATRFVILHKIKEFLRKHRNKLDFSSLYKESTNSIIITEYVRNRIDELVKNAELDCYEVCESCGRRFNEKHNPRCETTGWVSFKCEKCASMTNRNYIKNGKMYNNGKCIEESKNSQTEQ